MQWYEALAQILLIGIANGSLISLIALGYTLVYGIIELINFAHGDVFMIGTMLALSVVTWAPHLVGVNQPYLMPAPVIAIVLFISLIASMVTCALLNVAIYCADSRAGKLMLITGQTGEESDAHDWYNLLFKWGLLERDTVIAAYEAADPELSRSLDMLSDLMNTLLLATREAIAANPATPKSDALAHKTAAVLKPIVTRISALINGTAPGLSNRASVPQAAIDAMFRR